jgi:hypothetical protein
MLNRFKLEPSQLRAECDPKVFPFNDTTEVEPLYGVIGQKRHLCGQTLRPLREMFHPTVATKPQRSQNLFTTLSILLLKVKNWDCNGKSRIQGINSSFPTIRSVKRFQGPRRSRA